jgi:hypothetical protein
MLRAQRQFPPGFPGALSHAKRATPNRRRYGSNLQMASMMRSFPHRHLMQRQDHVLDIPRRISRSERRIAENHSAQFQHIDCFPTSSMVAFRRELPRRYHHRTRQAERKAQYTRDADHGFRCAGVLGFGNERRPDSVRFSRANRDRHSSLPGLCG